jgi:hypothetical protein
MVVVAAAVLESSAKAATARAATFAVSAASTAKEVAVACRQVLLVHLMLAGRMAVVVAERISAILAVLAALEARSVSFGPEILVPSLLQT